MNYENLVNIDLENIEVELINQAKNFFMVSKLLAEKSAKLERLDAHLRTAKAMATIDIKSQAAQNGRKLTLNDVECYIDTEPNLVRMNDERVELEMEKNILLGLVRGLEHKRDMLKSLSWSGSRDVS